MKIYLYFMEYKLGSLERCNLLEENGLIKEKYLWIPNVSEIEKAKIEYPFGMDMLMMPKENQVYDKVPYYFAENDVLPSRRDIIDKVGITPDDDLFTRLYKISTLEYFDQQFVTKIK